MRYGDMSKDKYVMRRYGIAKDMLKINSDDDVLDVGCYDGYFLSTLPESRKFGFDYDNDALKIAHARDIAINQRDIEKEWIGEPNNYYSVCICMEVLEHTRNPELVVKEMRRVTNGRYIISLPNECNLWTRIRMLLGWGINDIPFDPNYHLHFPSLKQCDKFISKHFHILKKRYWVYGFPEWFAFMPNLFARGVIYECV